jgi:hypothetical protein
MPHSKIPEFDRQLVGQEKGLNSLTIDEYLSGRAAFASGDSQRNPQRARSARQRYKQDMLRRHIDEFKSAGNSASEADRLANIKTDEKMHTLAALHNPDLIGGGKDIIGDFGDRQVNSSIGPQWKSRVRYLDEAVRAHIDSGSSIEIVEIRKEYIDASLTRCI